MSSVSSDRRVCPRCGSNNFATQAACWKCGAPLAAGPSSSAPPVSPPRPPAPGATPPAGAPAPAISAIGIDPAIASWASVALAVFFPFVAVPAGLVFLMLDDRRKADIGKLTLILGLVFSILHFVVTGWLMRASFEYLLRALPSGLPGRSAPAPDAPAPPLQFPGIPPAFPSR